VNLLLVGCGDLGTEVGLRAVAAGHRVHALRRRAELLPDDLHGIAADLDAPLPRLPDDVEVVVFTTAADDRTVDAYRRAYLRGPQRVLAHLQQAGVTPSRVVFVSSTAVYGVDDGSGVDEDTPVSPRTPTAEVLVAAEQALWARRPDAVVLRLAGIYGPGRTRLVERVRAGTAIRPDPDVVTNRIHRDDAAAAALHLATVVPGPQRCYLGVDDAPAPLGEVIAFLAGELGVPVPPSGPVERSRGGDKRGRNDRLRATGLPLSYPTFREGYRAVLMGAGVRHP